MAESGFISLELSRSQAPVTISKTAILFAEADNDTAYFHERRSLNNFHRDRVITFEQIAE